MVHPVMQQEAMALMFLWLYTTDHRNVRGLYDMEQLAKWWRATCGRECCIFWHCLFPVRVQQGFWPQDLFTIEEMEGLLTREGNKWICRFCGGACRTVLDIYMDDQRGQISGVRYCHLVCIDVWNRVVCTSMSEFWQGMCKSLFRRQLLSAVWFAFNMCGYQITIKPMNVLVACVVCSVWSVFVWQCSCAEALLCVYFCWCLFGERSVQFEPQNPRSSQCKIGPRQILASVSTRLETVPASQLHLWITHNCTSIAHCLWWRSTRALQGWGLCLWLQRSLTNRSYKLSLRTLSLDSDWPGFGKLTTNSRSWMYRCPVILHLDMPCERFADTFVHDVKQTIVSGCSQVRGSTNNNDLSLKGSLKGHREYVWHVNSACLLQALAQWICIHIHAKPLHHHWHIQLQRPSSEGVYMCQHRRVH